MKTTSLEPLKSTWNGCCWDEKAAETFGGSWVAIATGVPVCPSFPVTTFTWEKIFWGKTKREIIVFVFEIRSTHPALHFSDGCLFEEVFITIYPSVQCNINLFKNKKEFCFAIKQQNGTRDRPAGSSVASRHREIWNLIFSLDNNSGQRLLTSWLSQQTTKLARQTVHIQKSPNIY